jgi:hypothetical protein
MGTMSLIARAIANNNKSFFSTFVEVRERLEETLIRDKETIATILQKHPSKKRVEKYEEFLNGLIKTLKSGETPDDALLVKLLGLEGKVVIGKDVQRPTAFSDDSKSIVFLRKSLESALQCPICQGYLDTEKSISYDHIKPVRSGGVGDSDNCELMHPYCNQSVKEHRSNKH